MANDSRQYLHRCAWAGVASTFLQVPLPPRSAGHDSDLKGVAAAWGWQSVKPVRIMVITRSNSYLPVPELGSAKIDKHVWNNDVGITGIPGTFDSTNGYLWIGFGMLGL